jgi:hypothetical protein
VSNWSVIEQALVTWAAAKSGLGTGKVLWAESNARRPDGAFVTLRIADVTAFTVMDEIEIIDHTGDLVAPDAGEEIEFKAHALREFGVNVQCYAPPSGKAMPRGASSPRAVLEGMSASLFLPSVQDAFEAAGCSLLDRGPILYVPEIVGAGFEARAVMDLRFYVADTASEFTTYIERVQANGEDDLDQPGSGPDVDVEI